MPLVDKSCKHSEQRFQAKRTTYPTNIIYKATANYTIGYDTDFFANSSLYNSANLANGAKNNAIYCI